MIKNLEKTEIGITVTRVDNDGLTAEAGIGPGCRILAVNGCEMEDVLDFVFHSSEPAVHLVWEDRSGQRHESMIERPYGREMGVDFEPIRIKECDNRCPFCFVFQLPKGKERLRKPLYFKDEDYRLSFLYGHYITGTNLSERDFERIAEYHLSPLYLSIHATDTELRKQLLGRRRLEPVTDMLDFFRDNDIEFHAQIVLCPDFNDGEHLDKTIADLRSYWPSLRSVAIVPVGLTRHRRGLMDLTPVTPEYARDLIRKMKPVQRQFKREIGDQLIYVSDEFFLMSGTPLPSYRRRHEMPQIENGVGMVSRFMQPWKRTERRLPQRLTQKRRVGIVTGKLGEIFLTEIAERLCKIQNLEVELIPVVNRVFGEGITVSGLLCGEDICEDILSRQRCDYYLIPANMLRPWDELFLDDMTLAEMQERVNAPVYPLLTDAQGLTNAIIDHPEPMREHDQHRPNYEKPKAAYGL